MVLTPVLPRLTLLVVSVVQRGVATVESTALLGKWMIGLKHGDRPSWA